MSGRDAMQPLRMFGLWDAVEGELLRFVERAGAIVATLTGDDLGAHENGSEAPPAVTVSRLQEKELPRRLRLHFANYEHDHEASEQSASRLTTEAVNELDVELPISMTPDTAAQLAEIMLYAEWVGRSTYTFSLDNDWLHLEPTDCIEIPVEGETQRVRILAVNYKIGGLLEVEAQKDDDGSYTSVAVGNPGTPSGGVPGSSGNGPICPSAVVLLDIGRLREQDTDAGYYAAIYGLCPDFWSCAELYRSNDGGTTFGRVGRTDLETTVGEILTITGPATDPTLPGESPAYDTTTSITVELFEGTLSSISDAQIAAGQNLAAIGVHGRWVIIQFKTATLDTGDQWTLTDLIWGLNDTQHLLYTTVAGDSFVLLSDPALIRVPEEAAAIGVSKSFKVVTCGEPIDSVTAFDFTTWGLSYRRTCPSTVISATLTAPPSAAADGDAYLLPNDTALTDVWADHGGEVAHWSDETDSWVFCTPVPGTIITIGVDSSSDPGDGSVISDGDGNYNPALFEIDTSTDLSGAYFVAYTIDGYRKVPSADVAGGGSGSLTASNGVQLVADDIQLDIDGLTSIGSIDEAVDMVALYDDSLGSHRKAAVSSLISAATGVAMTFVGETVVAGSAATAMTVGSLSLSADGMYFIEFMLENATGGAIDISIYYNADTTAANYDREILSGSAGSSGASGANTAVFSGTIASLDICCGHAHIRNNFDAKPGAIGLVQRIDAATRVISLSAQQWRTAADLTSISIQSSVSNGLSVGSRLRVWRVST
jgi:hypothetical protein